MNPGLVLSWLGWKPTSASNHSVLPFLELGLEAFVEALDMLCRCWDLNSDLPNCGVSALNN